MVNFTKIDGTNKVCLKHILDLLSLNKIKLDVFSGNVRALNLHKKYNFKRASIKNVHDKQVFCMELVK